MKIRVKVGKRQRDRQVLSAAFRIASSLAELPLWQAPQGVLSLQTEACGFARSSGGVRWFWACSPGTLSQATFGSAASHGSL